MTAEIGVEGEEAHVCVVVSGGAGPVAPTLRALAAQDAPTAVEVVLCGPAPEGTDTRGLRLRSAAAMDPLSAVLLVAREGVSEVVYWLRAGDEPEPQFLRGTLETLRADASLGCVSCWIAERGSEKKGWRPERLDGAALLGESVPPPLAVRRDALLRLEGGAPLEPGLEEWEACLCLLESGVRAGVVRTPLILRSDPNVVAPAEDRGGGHLAAVRRVLGRHAAFSRSHLVDAVVRSEARILDLVRANHRLETLIALDLQPELERRQQELQRLERRLARPGRSASERS